MIRLPIFERLAEGLARKGLMLQLATFRSQTQPRDLPSQFLERCERPSVENVMKKRQMEH